MAQTWPKELRAASQIETCGTKNLRMQLAFDFAPSDADQSVVRDAPCQAPTQPHKSRKKGPPSSSWTSTLFLQQVRAVACLCSRITCLCAGLVEMLNKRHIGCGCLHGARCFVLSVGRSRRACPQAPGPFSCLKLSCCCRSSLVMLTGRAGKESPRCQSEHPALEDSQVLRVLRRRDGKGRCLGKQQKSRSVVMQRGLVIESSWDLLETNLSRPSTASDMASDRAGAIVAAETSADKPEPLLT